MQSLKNMTSAFGGNKSDNGGSLKSYSMKREMDNARQKRSEENSANKS